MSALFIDDIFLKNETWTINTEYPSDSASLEWGHNPVSAIEVY